MDLQSCKCRCFKQIFSKIFKAIYVDFLNILFKDLQSYKRGCSQHFFSRTFKAAKVVFFSTISFFLKDPQSCKSGFFSTISFSSFSFISQGSSGIFKQLFSRTFQATNVNFLKNFSKIL